MQLAADRPKGPRTAMRATVPQATQITAVLAMAVLAALTTLKTLAVTLVMAAMAAGTSKLRQGIAAIKKCKHSNTRTRRTFPQVAASPRHGFQTTATTKLNADGAPPSPSAAPPGPSPSAGRRLFKSLADSIDRVLSAFSCRQSWPDPCQVCVLFAFGSFGYSDMHF